MPCIHGEERSTMTLLLEERGTILEACNLHAPIVNKYREGKVKRTHTPGSEKEPEMASSQARTLVMTGVRYLLHNGSTTYA